MYPDDKHPSYGVFVKRFVEQARTSGLHVSLSVMHQSDSMLSKLVKYVVFYFLTFIKAIFRHYDIVYVHYPSYSALPIILAHKFRKNDLYINVHGSDVLPVTQGQEKMHRYTAAALSLADRVVVPSEYFLEVVCQKYELNADRIVVYPSGGINPEVFHVLPVAQKNAIKADLGFDSDLITVCFAGRITEGKGWDTYLMAIAEVLSQGKRLNALLIGSGDQDAQCEKLIEKLELTDSVMRMDLQSQERLCEFYNAADIFAFPGRRRSESLGLVAIEAMACGVPVVASDFAAPKGYIRSGYNGWLIPPSDYHALAEIFNKAISDPSVTSSLRCGALETALHFSGEALMKQFEKIFSTGCDS